MSNAWPKLWDKVCGPKERKMFFQDAIDLWGYRILDRLGDGPEPVYDAEVATLDWIYIRRTWLTNLPWKKIDAWIQKHCPSARELPQDWSFIKIIKEAMREKIGLALEV